MSDERLARLAHDLRTPLTIVQGFSELLQRNREALTSAQQDEYLARIAAAATERRELLDAERDERVARGQRP